VDPPPIPNIGDWAEGMFAIGNETETKGNGPIGDEAMPPQRSTQTGMPCRWTPITTKPHPCNPSHPRSKSAPTLHRGFHGLRGGPAAGSPGRRHTEANRRLTAPPEAGSQFESSCCARPALPAAVAHLGRSVVA
jgi:hypothetical protein